VLNANNIKNDIQNGIINIIKEKNFNPKNATKTPIDIAQIAIVIPFSLKN